MSQHDRLRNLIRRSPVFTGMRIAIRDDRLEVLEPEDLVFGLGPLFDAVAGTPEDRWPSLVDDCLGRMLGVLTGGAPELDGPTEPLLDRVYAKIRPAEGSPAYAKDIAPGLVVTLALDHADHITIMNDEHVQRHGFDRLFEVGMDNLYEQLPAEHATCDGVYIISGAEYTASTAMIIPGVVEVVTGSDEFPYGVLLAMPNDHMLVFHVLRDSAGVRYAMGEIAQLAAEYYVDSDRPLSPNVHWWQPGVGYFESVAHQAGDGHGVIGAHLRTRYPPAFAHVLEQLDRARG